MQPIAKAQLGVLRVFEIRKWSWWENYLSFYGSLRSTLETMGKWNDKHECVGKWWYLPLGFQCFRLNDNCTTKRVTVLKILGWKSQSSFPLNYGYIKWIQYWVSSIPLNGLRRRCWDGIFSVVSSLSWVPACFHFTTLPGNFLRGSTALQLEMENGILRLRREFS